LKIKIVANQCKSSYQNVVQNIKHSRTHYGIVWYVLFIGTMH